MEAGASRLSLCTLADGVNWAEVNQSSKVIVNGNLSVNEFNTTLQLNSSQTEYYGNDVLLEAGVYDRLEIPYKNRNSTAQPAYLYAIILDQSNTTIAYKRLFVGSNANTEGSFTINFDEDILIETGGIYTVVIGRRGWNPTSKRVELFQKDVNSSDGRVWVAYTGNNPSLDADDTSAVNWATITKQNFNKITNALIYKF